MAIDRRPAVGPASGKVSFFQMDVLQPLGDLFRERGVDTLFHLAFVLRPGHDREAAQRVNVSGASNVLDASAAAGVRRVVYLSSATVYGAHPDNPPLLTEDSPVRPAFGFQYAWDKALAEGIFDRYAADRRDSRVAAFRSCVVMGPRAENFITQAFAKPFLVAVRGYDPPLQFVHEDDIMELMVLAARDNDILGVYNVAGKGAVPYSEMVEMSGKRLLGVPSLLLYQLVQGAWALRLQGDSRAAGLDYIRYPWTVDTAKVERETGFQIRYTSREALQSYFG